MLDNSVSTDRARECLSQGSLLSKTPAVNFSIKKRLLYDKNYHHSPLCLATLSRIAHLNQLITKRSAQLSELLLKQGNSLFGFFERSL